MPNRPSKFGQQINNHSTILICGAQSIVLPAPNFSNGESFEYNRVNSRTRGGDLIMHREPYWPKTKVFKKQFTIFDKGIRERLLIFMRENLGRKLTLLDHENRAFKVIIRNPDADFSEQQSGAHTISLEFETE